MDNDFATGYALGSDSGNGNNSGFGGWGDGLWAIIILAMIWGGNGWGGFGGGSNSPGFQGYATRADVNEAIAFNGVERGISNIQQGICDSTYALNNAITSGFNNTNVAMLQGFSGVDKSMCQLGYNLQDCCCQTQNAIQGVRYDMATQACDTRNTIQNSTRDIIAPFSYFFVSNVLGARNLNPSVVTSSTGKVNLDTTSVELIFFPCSFADDSEESHAETETITTRERASARILFFITYPSFVLILG